MSGPPVQSHGFQTSVDTARQQTTTIAGFKRPRQNSVYTEPATSVTTSITAAAAAAATAAAPRSTGTRHNNDPPSPKRRPVNFIRAPAATHEIRIAASPIRSTANNNAVSAIPSLAPPPAPSQSAATSNPLLSLQHPKYGLPPALVANFQAVGIHSIYPWQASCLLGRGHLTAEKNLLYTAPTGGGKSLVADVLMLKRVIENPHRKAILVLPYIALVQEKLKWLRRIVQDVEKNVDTPDSAKQKWKQPSKEIRVTGFFGGSKSRATWADTDIAVCTIEKANALVNTAIAECNIDDLAVVVVDEIHMLDDDSRGYLLELMVTKLLLLQQDIQIIGMSATLSNTELLAEWLRASFHASTHRPVPIEEYLVYENSIYPAISSKEFFQTATKLQSVQDTVPPCRRIDQSPFKALSHPTANAMVSLAIETATAGFGALVFCGSRHACQMNAQLISEAMPSPSTLDSELLERRLDLLDELGSLPCGLDPAFQNTIIKGVAFHHAGLTTEERDLVAEAYDQGTIKVIVATCSLAAGVNLPARRVIMQGARMGRDIVGPALLRQMRGRAGRKGKDTVGETYLICQQADLEAISEIWDAETPAIDSCLAQDNKGVKRALLEGIATRLVSGCEAIDEFMRCTLLCKTRSEAEMEKLIDSSLQELIDTELIHLRDDGNNSYESTKLGAAIVASSFAPDDGVFVYEELKRALQAFVMDGEMHIFYMFTPLSVAMNTNIDWLIFRDQLDLLDESGIRALLFVGVQPGFVNNMVHTGRNFKEDDPKQQQLSRIYRRAYAAFQLRDLCNEVPLSTIASRYNVPRGIVQTLAQTCHGFAAGMVKFCQRMGWGMLAVVLEHMRDRLQAGARDDLLEMAQVTHVKSWTARLLWENGFRSVRALASADAKDIVPVLMMARSRKSQSQTNTEKEVERHAAKLARKAEAIIASANKIYERQMQVEIDE
ncbi:DNA-directed DNA polymerase theta, putative [Talaromyces stipitatus ATCC 10500]|uniref:DNA-directed DNA polymerase theta, putative n=1 Tax=Talaromyces stipitatus (strain ATCC 10500 / CBS 375.48 / QM 6759 / NRRL 1006) TaxID=441959 RepID=B8MH57_TALSN|nr:DNA-directed DNA polymerase theta, putative [Talaromyces stipitatus ATCC 10500]EED16871.1 DNA-directed DNA polymerase theta, putative [Talaromyces stipitatus ATCC 10500]